MAIAKIASDSARMMMTMKATEQSFKDSNSFNSDKPFQVICPCGKAFSNFKDRRVNFCSEECKVKATRKRKAEFMRNKRFNQLLNKRPHGDVPQ